MNISARPTPLLGLAIVVGACFNPTRVPLGSGEESSTGGPVAGVTSTGVLDMSTGSTGGSVDPGSTGLGAESSSGSTDSGSTGGATTDPIAPERDCDPWTQDCPQGEKCVPTVDGGGSTWNALSCVPVDPDPVQVGQSCVAEAFDTGIDNCAVGSICWGMDPETLEGQCVAQCLGSIDTPWCEAAATSCVVANGGVINLCLPTCDPLVQDCPAGEGCYLVVDDLNCAPDASAGTAHAGDACEAVNACAPGNMCLQTELLTSCDAVIGCCTPFCDATAPFDRCPGGTEECLPLLDAPGFEQVGVCAVEL